MNSVLSATSDTLFSSTGCQKLGQPVPDSNFVLLSKSGWPQQTQLKTPSSLQFQYSPVKARSVPFLRVTSYCCGVSCFCHSVSVFSICPFMGLPLLSCKPV